MASTIYLSWANIDKYIYDVSMNIIWCKAKLAYLLAYTESTFLHHIWLQVVCYTFQGSTVETKRILARRKLACKENKLSFAFSMIGCFAMYIDFCPGGYSDMKLNLHLKWNLNWGTCDWQLDIITHLHLLVVPSTARSITCSAERRYWICFNGTQVSFPCGTQNTFQPFFHDWCKTEAGHKAFVPISANSHAGVLTASCVPAVLNFAMYVCYSV